MDCERPAASSWRIFRPGFPKDEPAGAAVVHLLQRDSFISQREKFFSKLRGVRFRGVLEPHAHRIKDNDSRARRIGALQEVQGCLFAQPVRLAGLFHIDPFGFPNQHDRCGALFVEDVQGVKISSWGMTRRWRFRATRQDEEKRCEQGKNKARISHDGSGLISLDVRITPPGRRRAWRSASRAGRRVRRCACWRTPRRRRIRGGF